MFVFILALTAKVISEHRPINVVSQPGIETETLRFQDNHEAHNATEAARRRRRLPCNCELNLNDLSDLTGCNTLY